MDLLWFSRVGLLTGKANPNVSVLYLKNSSSYLNSVLVMSWVGYPCRRV